MTQPFPISHWSEGAPAGLPRPPQPILIELNMTDPSTMLDGPGAAPPNSGDAVSLIQDQGPEQNDLVQASGANRPTYQDNLEGATGGVVFPGGAAISVHTDVDFKGGPVSNTGSVTIFVQFRRSDTTTVAYLYDAYLSTTERLIAVCRDDLSGMHWHRTSQLLQNSGPAGFDTDLHVAACVYNGDGSGQAYMDNILSRDGTIGANFWRNLRVGSRNTGTTVNTFIGNMYYFIGYRGALTLTQLSDEFTRINAII